MNRIDKAIAEAKGRKLLVTYVTAGDPDMSVTEQAVLEMFEKGADIAELGVPFSDPIAEGAAIQKASLRSLEKGTTLDKIFTAVENIRKHTDKPLVLMMYLNTIFAYGTDKFFALCKEKGIDGVVVPDMPFEERDEVMPYADKYGVYNINCVSPISGERIKMIAENSKGFMSCVYPGVMSADKVKAFFDLLKNSTDIPCCAGNVSDTETAARVAPYCDGIVIGGAVVEAMAACNDNCAQKAGEVVMNFVRAMK